MKGPEIIPKHTLPVAYIETRVSLADWGKANALFPKIMDWIHQKGGQIAGPPFFQYFRLGDFEKEYHLRAGVVTNEVLESDETVLSTQLLEGNYLSLIHHGHPDKLEETHKKIQTWAKEHNIVLARSNIGKEVVWEGRFEFYLTKPDEEPDPNKWQTEILYLIK